MMNRDKNKAGSSKKLHFLKDLKSPKKMMCNTTSKANIPLALQASVSSSCGFEAKCALKKGLYEVEKILGRQSIDGKVYCFLKWKGFPDSFNSWEPEKNITNFRRRTTKNVKSPDNVDPQKRIKKKQPTNTNEISHNEMIMEQRKPYKILGAKKTDGEIDLLVQFRQGDDENEAEIVPAKEANVKWPQQVIQFYEGRIVFRAAETSMENAGKEGDQQLCQQLKTVRVLRNCVKIHKEIVSR